MKREQEKMQILNKHTWISAKSNNMKEMMRQSDCRRMEEEWQRRSFMQSKRSPNPYEEVKAKYYVGGGVN